MESGQIEQDNGVFYEKYQWSIKPELCGCMNSSYVCVYIDLYQPPGAYQPPLLFRNYFAFVVRDGTRYQCYVFMENSVPAATIITTIQRMLAPESSKMRW